MAVLDHIELPNGVTYDISDASARKLDNNDFDTINVTELNAGDVIVTGAARFLNTINGNISGNAETATSATKATQDESGNNIKSTYANAISISDHTITLKNKNGTSLGTVTVPDNNTTYTVATGTANGKIKVTPSSGSAYEVSVYGLKSAAYKDVTDSYSATGTDPVSGKAVAAAIDGLPSPMVFRGSLGTGGTITALPIDGTAKVGDTYKVITAGTYASKAAKVGDTFICLTKTSSANTWELIPSGDEPSGTVTSVAISNGGGLSVSGSPITSSGTITISHADTSSQASVDNSGRTYIQDISLDTYGHVTKITSATETVVNTDRYVNSAAFADATSADANNPVKMTLTRAGSDTASVTAYLPKVSSSSAGVAPKGAAVSSQSQSTKFLREDGTWAAPSYTTNTNTTYSLSASGESVVLSGSDSSSKSVSLSTLINGLSEGYSPATSGDYIVAQYAGGGTTTKTYHRRKLSNIFKAMSSNDITTALGYTPPHEPVKDIPNTPAPIATFSGAANLPLSSLKVAVTPYQDLHGYDAPWAGGAGKNKFNPTNLFANKSLYGNDAVGTSPILHDSNASKVYKNIAYLNANTTYVLSFRINGSMISTNARKGYICDNNGLVLENNITTQNSIDNYVTITPTTSGWLWGAFDNSTTDLQIEQGTSPTTFAPYSNICPIIGWDEAVVSVSGKNLFDYTKITAVSAGSVGDRNGTLFNKVGTYSVNAVNSGSYMYVRVFNSDGSIKSTYNIIVGTTITPATFTISSGEWFVVYDANPNTLDVSKGLFENWQVQVELSSQPTTYSPYNGATYTIDLNGTRYGGTLDVLSGVMTVDRAYVDLGTRIWSQIIRNDIRYFYIIINDMKAGSNVAYAINSHYSKSVGAPLDKTFSVGWAYLGNQAFCIRDDSISSVSDFKTAMNGVQLVYELATPITVQLAQTPVKSLEGKNSIFANCGQITEVKYVVQDYSDITSKISEFAQLATTASKLGSSNVGSATQPIYLNGGTATACTYTLGKSVPSDAVFTDTKNTAGSTDTSSKIFLIGATSQAANPQTYSDNKVFVTSGVLTTKSVQVGGGSATMEYDATTQSINFIFN